MALKLSDGRIRTHSDGRLGVEVDYAGGFSFLLEAGSNLVLEEMYSSSSSDRDSSKDEKLALVQT